MRPGTKRAGYDELVLLASIWGASFLLMRVSVGDFGPVALTALRVGVAAAVLLPLAALRGQLGVLRTHARPIVVVGLLNSTLPFVAFGYAAQYISAGLSSVFNATAPLWGALVAWLWLAERPTRSRALGLVIGFAGVAWLAWDKVGLKSSGGGGTMFAVFACLGATLCYGISVNYTRRCLAQVPPMAVAASTQLVAAVAMAGPAAWLWPSRMPAPSAWASAIVLGLLCTALAYLLYFRLIAHLGPVRAISVTFLIPLFGVLWGVLFLGERVTAAMLGAGAVIVLGTALASGALTLRLPAARREPR